MIAVIFEAELRSGGESAYLETAARLSPLLRDIDGFVSVERFRSLQNSDKLLSLSFWRDEEAVDRWRNQESHRAAQSDGRSFIFADYRLRICAVARDYGMEDRREAPDDSLAVNR